MLGLLALAMLLNPWFDVSSRLGEPRKVILLDGGILRILTGQNGWQTILAIPLLLTWCLFSLAPICRIELGWRKFLRARGRKPKHTGARLTLLVVTFAWMPLVALIHGPGQIGAQLVEGLTTFFVLYVLGSLTGGLAWIADYPNRILRQRIKQGQCIHCGYSLQGNVSGVCPECGASAPRPPNIEGIS